MRIGIGVETEIEVEIEKALLLEAGPVDPFPWAEKV